MSTDAPPACEIIVTGPTDDTLDRIARQLVDARLIACANVLDAPVTSTYRWEGAVEVEPERRMHMHTRLELADQVVAFVKQRHPYDVPNVTAIPLVAGNADYFGWIEAETPPSSQRRDVLTARNPARGPGGSAGPSFS